MSKVIATTQRPRNLSRNSSSASVSRVKSRGLSPRLHRPKIADDRVQTIAMQPVIWSEFRDDLRPLACYMYFDTVGYHLGTPITEADQAMLRDHCKMIDIRAHGEWVRPKKGEPYQINIEPYRFRVEIHVPDAIAIDYFARRRKIRVSRVDLAVDVTFASHFGSHLLLERIQCSLYQRNTGSRRWNVNFPNGGISSGRRHPGLYFTYYNSKECRIDGTPACFHGEARNHGSIAISAIGIDHPRDLRNFNHAAFWLNAEKSPLVEIDFERLGRWYRNSVTGQKRRKSSDQPTKHDPRNEDQKAGHLLFRLYGDDPTHSYCSTRRPHKVQRFIREFGDGPFLRRFSMIEALGMELNISEISRVDTGGSRRRPQPRIPRLKFEE